MIMEEQLNILLLQETKCTKEEARQILPRWWINGEKIETYARGNVRGLAILRNSNTLKVILTFSNHWTILIFFRTLEKRNYGYLTNVYGPQLFLNKLDFFQSSQHLRDLMDNQHWIIGGDFNIITSL